MKQQLAQEINRKVEGVAGKMSKGIAAKAAKKMKELTLDLEKIDKAALLAAQEAVLEQERREKERRRRETVRRIDYFTRAVRLEEREVLIANAEKKKQEDRAQLEADFARYVEEHKKAHERAMAERERLSKMTSEKDVFMEQLITRRREVQAAEREKQMQRFEVRKRRARKGGEKEERGGGVSGEGEGAAGSRGEGETGEGGAEAASSRGGEGEKRGRQGEERASEAGSDRAREEERGGLREEREGEARRARCATHSQTGGRRQTGSRRQMEKRPAFRRARQTRSCAARRRA